MAGKPREGFVLEQEGRKMEKQHASLPPSGLYGAGRGGRGSFNCMRMRPHDHPSCSLPSLVRAQRSPCSLEPRPEHMSGSN